jgi:hypothetical protein
MNGTGGVTQVVENIYKYNTALKKEEILSFETRINLEDINKPQTKNKYCIISLMYGI